MGNDVLLTTLTVSLFLLLNTTRHQGSSGDLGLGLEKVRASSMMHICTFLVQVKMCSIAFYV